MAKMPPPKPPKSGGYRGGPMKPLASGGRGRIASGTPMATKKKGMKPPIKRA